MECADAMVIANDNKYRLGGELMLLKYEVLDKRNKLDTGCVEFAVMANPSRGF